MQAESPPSRGFVPSRRLLIALGVLTVVLDQGTKAMVRALLPLYDSVAVIPGFLDFTYVQNTGAAFGLLNSADVPFKSAIMTVVALTALIAIAVYAMKTSSQDPVGQIGLALVMGGAVGNLIDRVTTGYRRGFSSTRTGAIGTSGRSTSPMRRSRLAPVY